MSIFGSIMGKIFGQRPTVSASASSSSASPASAAPAAQAPAANSAPVAAPAPDQVDVGAVLSAMADMKGGGGNYQSSIVDLLKLLDLDSSLAARRQLAEELNVRAGEDGSAEQNIALHKAVMAKLAENGGVVPDTLRN